MGRRTVSWGMARQRVALVGLVLGLGGCAGPLGDFFDDGAVGSGGTSGSTDAVTSGRSELSCSDGALRCGESCVRLDVDPMNCGGCGIVCQPGDMCADGVCTMACRGDDVPCGDECVDVSSDHDRCGSCDVRCGDDQVCADGACASSCAASDVACGGGCVDTASDERHCGACDHACDAGESCVDGACELVCVGGTTRCGDLCVDLNVDADNCGVCGNGCAVGDVCSSGECGLFCAGGTTRCDDACVDVKVDAANCGACGNVCDATEMCVDGACAAHCGLGTELCGGMCVSLMKDKWNCGGCGNACPDHEVCMDGMCTLGCSSGTERCDDACVALSNDPANCGACDQVCPGAPNAAAVCVSASCDLACIGSFADCDASGANGCEVDVANDPASCGGCGNACPVPADGEPTCDDGVCGVACHQGFANCDVDLTNGCEASLDDDVANCGACDNVCGADEECSAGECRVPALDYNLGLGAHWITEPPTYSCVEACAHVFGGLPGDWACSIEATSITHTAWYDGNGTVEHCPGGTPAPEALKDAPNYVPGAHSALVRDNCPAAVNYCFEL